MSALTRLLEELPREFFDDGRMAQGASVMTALGGSMIALGAVLACFGFESSQAGLIAGASGPAIAGVVNLGLGVLFRKRAKATEDIRLTADARQLLLALSMERVPRRTTFGHHAGGMQTRNARPLVVVPAPLEAKLEAFAQAYLDLKAAAEGNTAHGIRARVAGDEALAEGLNAAAASIRFPDGDAAPRLDRLTEGLREAAVRLDPRDSSPGALSALLNDLREEEQARQELLG
ncbi:hypothetical protein EON79_20705 [bacterium]|nr:MAG: hypothetical protein EON79_20705 [bacterium]